METSTQKYDTLYFQHSLELERFLSAIDTVVKNVFTMLNRMIWKNQFCSSSIKNKNNNNNNKEWESCKSICVLKYQTERLWWHFEITSCNLPEFLEKLIFKKKEQEFNGLKWLKPGWETE